MLPSPTCLCFASLNNGQSATLSHLFFRFFMSHNSTRFHHVLRMIYIKDGRGDFMQKN